MALITRDNRNGDIPLDDKNELTPSYKNVYVDQSTDVYFGDQNIFHGPVTVEKIVLSNGRHGPPADNAYVTDGHDGNIKKAEESKNNDTPTTTNWTAFDIPKTCVWLRTKSKQKPFIITLIVAGVILCIIISLIVVLVKVLADKPLVLLPRSAWGASPPSNTTTPLVTPVPYVIIHHTATANCSYTEECIRHVQFIQTFHVESRQFFDIGYNFLVGGDGTAFEGRGWTVEGAHSYGYNFKSIGIAFIGTFNNIRPPDVQMSACKKLMAKGVELGYIQKDYKLFAARQLAGTESPGAELYSEMKTWPHWALEP